MVSSFASGEQLVGESVAHKQYHFQSHSMCVLLSLKGQHITVTIIRLSTALHVQTAIYGLKEVVPLGGSPLVRDRQWGYRPYEAGTRSNVYYPIAFTSKVFIVLATSVIGSNGFPVVKTLPNLSYFDLDNATRENYWLALGQ